VDEYRERSQQHCCFGGEDGGGKRLRAPRSCALGSGMCTRAPRMITLCDDADGAGCDNTALAASEAGVFVSAEPGVGGDGGDDGGDGMDEAAGTMGGERLRVASSSALGVAGRTRAELTARLYRST